MSIRDSLKRRAVLCCVVLIVSPAATARAELPPKTQRLLTMEVIPAYQRGDSASLLATLSPLVIKMTDAQMDEADLLLKEQEIPNTAALLVEARMHMLNQGIAKKLPRASTRETLLLLESIKSNVEGTVSRNEGVMDVTQRPKTFDADEAALWNIHVSQNELRNISNSATHAVSLQSMSQRVNRHKLNDDQIVLLDTEFGEQLSNIQQAQRQLLELELELRLQRLQMAAESLNADSEIKDRIQGAFVADLDGEVLANVLKERDSNEFERPYLRGCTAAQVQEHVETIRETVGDLVEKSRLFYVGLHWWLRGRYGQGPDGRGLLKRADFMRSAKSQFGLYMPAKTPQPTDPTSTAGPIPEIYRRHHYIWQYEYRRILGHYQTTGTSSSEVGGEEIVAVRTFY
ncbi:MAG TPA: hypothetical protein DCY79_18945 [Planctomycetaceae bacterium]|nr:hypothetical protein [Planctomycetaceae bacterium]